jgi:hypothetical protein
MRRYLVTKFVCSKCKHTLDVSYQEPNERVYIGYEQGEPTGCEKVDQVVKVDPCVQCTKPAQDAVQAIKTLLELTGRTK